MRKFILIAAMLTLASQALAADPAISTENGHGTVTAASAAPDTPQVKELKAQIVGLQSEVQYLTIQLNQANAQAAAQQAQGAYNAAKAQQSK